MITLRFWGKLETFGDLAQALYGALDNIIVDSEIVEEDMHFKLKDDTILTMHIPTQSQNPDDFQVIQKEFMLYISQVNSEKIDVKIGLIQQLAYFNTMLEIKFDDIGDEARLEHLLICSTRATDILNGILVLPNLNVLDGMGNMILGHDGSSDFDTYTPKMEIQYEREFTCEDEMRYTISKNILKDKGIPFIDKPMQFALTKKDCNIRSIEVIAGRLIALFATALYSDYMLNNPENFDLVMSKLYTLNEKFAFIEFSTDRELAYLNSNNFDKNLGIQYAWYYECVASLCWILGIYEDIGEPICGCEVNTLCELINKFSSIDELTQNCNMLSLDELLQEQDLIIRYHYACIEQRINNTSFDYPLVEEIVSCRNLTLNWVLTDIFGEDWDNVKTLV